MGTPERTIDERLGRIESRLEVLEKRLGVAVAVPVPASRERWVEIPATPVVVVPGFRAAHPAAAPMAPPTVPPRVPAPVVVEAPSSKAAVLAGVVSGAPNGTNLVPAHGGIASPRPALAPSAPKPRDLETWFGTKWLSIAGSLAVVAGVVFFLKYAVDQGWIGKLPMWTRCAAGAIFGFALMGVGEWARRKINALASAGLSSAGIACVYASVYAAYGYAKILDPSWAFVLLAATSALGIAISVRSRLAVVAVVSLIGAYLAPILMHTQHPNPLVFPVYTLALLCTGLVMSAWLRGPFRWVGRMVWWATVIFGGAWAAANAGEHPAIVIGYVGAVWAAIHVASVVQVRGETAVGDDVPITKVTVAESAHVLASLAVTSWTTGLAVLALRSTGLPLWMAPAAMLVACAMLGLTMASHLRVLTDVPRTARERLGAGLLVQCAGLLIAMVALATSTTGAGAVVVWLAMGLAAIGAGRWMNAKSLEIYGVVLLAIGTGRLVLFDSWSSGLLTGPVYFAGLQLTGWTAYAAIAGAAWLAAGWLLAVRRPGAGALWPSVVCSAVGVTALCLGLVHRDVFIPSLVGAWLLIGTVATFVDRLVPRSGLRWVGLGPVTIASAIAVVSAGALTASSNPAQPEAWLSVGAWHLTPHVAALLGAGLAWALQAWRVRGQIAATPALRPLGVFAACNAAALIAASPLSTSPPASVWMWTWIVVGIGCAALSTLERRLQLATASLVALALSCGAWVVAFVARDGAWDHSTAPMLLHEGLLSAMVLAVCLLVTRRLAELREVTSAMAVGAVAILWAGTSFEFARIVERVVVDPTVRAASVSVWWALYAVGLVIAGFWRKLAAARYAGLALLAAAGVKMVIFDLAHVPQLARIASFIILGLLMLGVAAGYAKAAAKLKPGTVAGNEPA